MKGYRISPETDENLCPCDDFINTGKCCCKLWVEK